MLSNNYKYICNLYWWNWFSNLPNSINTFERVIYIFEKISCYNDFEHFRRNFPPEWIFIPSIRLKRKDLWVSFFKYIYIYHKKNDINFLIRLKEKGIFWSEGFTEYMESLYYNILKWWLDYDEDSDLTITFSKYTTKYIIKNYCTFKKVDLFNKKINIHPVEIRWVINKVLFYRATIENNFADKMFDDYPEWKNSKRLAKDFLKYYYKK